MFFPSVLKNGLSCVIYSFSIQLPWNSLFAVHLIQKATLKSWVDWLLFWIKIRSRPYSLGISMNSTKQSCQMGQQIMNQAILTEEQRFRIPVTVISNHNQLDVFQWFNKSQIGPGPLWKRILFNIYSWHIYRWTTFLLKTQLYLLIFYFHQNSRVTPYFLRAKD